MARSRACITTEGHRDEIEIRRGYKEDIWDPSAPPPLPAIAPRRRRRGGLPNASTSSGEVVTPARRGGSTPARSGAWRSRGLQKVESLAVVSTLLVRQSRSTRGACASSSAKECYPECDGFRCRCEVMPTRTRSSSARPRRWSNAYVGPRVEKLSSCELAEARCATFRLRVTTCSSCSRTADIMTAEFLRRGQAPSQRSRAPVPRRRRHGGLRRRAPSAGVERLHRHRHGWYEL